jgi:hypothetical protein
MFDLNIEKILEHWEVSGVLSNEENFIRSFALSPLCLSQSK